MKQKAGNHAPGQLFINEKIRFKTGRIIRSLSGIVLFVSLVIGMSGCEENMWLRSEKKLRGKIEGSWNKLFVTQQVVSKETWTFKDGVLVITGVEKNPNSIDDGIADVVQNDGSDTLSMDIGNYSIDAKIDNAYLKLSNLEKNVVESAKQGLNGKWTIVDIDNNTLYIAAENGSAIIQREFEKN